MENQKYSVLFWLYQKKQKEGKSCIYMRLTVDGKRVEIATPHYILPTQWDVRRNRVKSNAPNGVLINGALDHASNAVKNHFLQSVSQGKRITASELKQLYLGKSEKTTPKTLLDAFEYHRIKMTDLIKAGKVAKATLAKYNYCQGKVESFLKHRYKAQDKPLQELSLKFVTEFEHFLLVNEGMQTNSAHKYIVNLKRIMNVAVSLEWIPKNPFDNFRCSYTNPEREILTQHELNALLEKEIQIQRLDEIRDVFLFCCYTGFAFADVHKFDRDTLTIGMDGKYWISTIRQKTGTRESVPLLPVPLEIVEKYKQHRTCSFKNKLLPVVSNQKYNAYLKELATICGIKKNLTSHIARHTFATTVTLSNGVPLETVSKMLGHTKLATTQIYAKVLDSKVSSDMSALSDILSAKVPELKIKRS